MPLLRIQTNVSLSEDSCAALLRKATAWAATELKKPVDYVQVVLQAGVCMAFAGTTEPTAFLELRALNLPKDRTKALSAGLCRLAEEALQVAPSRVFINFSDVPGSLWGWNGSSFG
jgi:phenylpyruvate tautomerase